MVARRCRAAVRQTNCGPRRLVAASKPERSGSEAATTRCMSLTLTRIPGAVGPFFPDHRPALRQDKRITGSGGPAKCFLPELGQTQDCRPLLPWTMELGGPQPAFGTQG